MALLWIAIIFLAANAYGAYWLLAKLAGPLGLATYDPLYLIPVTLGLGALGLLLGFALAKPVAQALFFIGSYVTFAAVPVAFGKQLFGEKAIAFVEKAAQALVGFSPDRIPLPQIQNSIFVVGVAMLVYGLLSRRLYRFLKRDPLPIKMFTNLNWTGRDWLFMGQDMRMVIVLALWSGLIYAKLVSGNPIELAPGRPSATPYAPVDQLTIVAAQTVTAGEPPPVRTDELPTEELEPTAPVGPKEIAGFQFSADLQQATITTGKFGGARLDLRSGAIAIPDPLKAVTAPRHKLARRLNPAQDLYFNWVGDLLNLSDGRRTRVPLSGKRMEPVFFTNDGQSILIYDDTEKSLRMLALAGADAPVWEIPLRFTPLDDRVASGEAASKLMRIVSYGEPAPNQLSMIVGSKNYFVIDFAEMDLTKIDRETSAFHAAYSAEGDLIAFTARVQSQSSDGQLLTLITKEVSPIKWKGRVLHLSSHVGLAITRMDNKISAWSLSQPDEPVWTLDLPVKSKDAPAAVSADGKVLICFDDGRYSWIPVSVQSPAEFKSFPAKFKTSTLGFFRNDQYGHLMAHVYGGWATVFWLKFPNGDGFNSLTADFDPYLGP